MADLIDAPFDRSIPPDRAGFSRLASLWLTGQVHFDALRAAPRRYMVALKWRVLGKKVRARGQMAPLLAMSPRAYRLWAMHADRAARQASLPDPARPIIALIDAGTNNDPGDAALLARTQASLRAEGLPFFQVGGAHSSSLSDVAAAIDWQADPWIMPALVGDTVAVGTAAAYRAAMAETKARVIYADDDVFLKGRFRDSPHFKPDWNSALFEHFDYLTGACIVRAGRDALSAVADRADWAQRLVSGQAAGSPVAPLHLRAVLHHRRVRPSPAVPARPLALHPELPSLSVIVPTRNRRDLLSTCLDGLEKTHYPDLEIIVVDNDSDDQETLAYLASLEAPRYRVIRHSGPFNYSAINNRAVDAARGTLICLLNNDIEIIEPDWLRIMATSALRPDVGAVGARLLYPDGRIQHAGVVIGVGNAAGHAHRFLRPEQAGYFQRHNLPQFTAAVTAACLVVARDRFLAVGGLDEQNFAVAFNDVDLCLRLNAQGWQSFYEPRATLFHHESVSRGLDRDPIGAARFAGELSALQRLWQTNVIVDPFHHPQLSRASEQFSIGL
ncbi:MULTISPECIES: glycosyltransferase family 2 protein [unclassified Novosphingobium]|uniref:glycosyltransferase family 2 protein n=1 Tax=unclassified Novosphingobium TaxID=2644732 RepID=UPI00146B2028|nr:MULTISPECIES: glycosyltransferase family 2 protein [unclassified Novosphingobium]NMN03186.1 GT2 family glycosyltransferase [Novosphingobium sp. SG919]NMN86824.1 GT2 family glycosyltransferase [Novosphingobium sp. SG916]